MWFPNAKPDSFVHRLLYERESHSGARNDTLVASWMGLAGLYNKAEIVMAGGGFLTVSTDVIKTSNENPSLEITHRYYVHVRRQSQIS